MVAVVASLAVLGHSATAGLPADGLLNSVGKVVQNGSLNGNTAASCGGVAPVKTLCGGPVDSGACNAGCMPGISGTLGYTGTVWSYIDGFNADGTPASAWRECSLLAGQTIRSGTNEVGYCHDGSNAREGCGLDCVVLYPPYALRGVATPPNVAGAQRGPTEAGTWTVSVVSS